MSDLIERLREYASNNGYSHGDYADTMSQAADSITTLKEQNALLTVQVKRHRELLQYIRDNILDGWSMDDLDNLLAEPIDLSAHPQQVKSEDARDAERYRWLRYNSGYTIRCTIFDDVSMFDHKDADLDDAIDAAIAVRNPA